jgi:hypothetical protein
MAVRIVCVDPNSRPEDPRVIVTGQSAAFGEEIEIEDSDLADNLLAQSTVWTKPNTKAAHDAVKEAKARARRESGDS